MALRSTFRHAVISPGMFATVQAFLDGDGPRHLPGHTTLDVSVGKSFGEYWLVGLQTVNLTNRRFLLDSANTFGGTHFAEPRQIYVEVRYRFHY